MAGTRDPRQPRRVDHDDRAQPSDRPAAARADPSREDGAARRARGARVARRRRDRRERHPRRPAPADLHLLPPGAADGCAGRAHAEDPGRAHHGRDRPRVPGPRADDGAAPRPRQAQDPRGRDPLPRAAGRAPARAPARCARRPVPGLQRGLRGHVGSARSDRALRRGDPARPRPRDADARRTRGGGPARAHAAAALAARTPGRVRGASWSCSRTRTGRGGTTR